MRIKIEASAEGWGDALDMYGAKIGEVRKADVHVRVHPSGSGRAEVNIEIELDDELPEAHTSLGYVALTGGWDGQTAERELGRAIELNPSDAQAHQWFAQVALLRRRFTESVRRVDRARELDPLSVVIQDESGWPYMYMGNTRNVEIPMARFREAARMDPSFAMAQFNIGNCHEILGRLDDAISCYRKAVELSQRMPFALSFLGAALARAGGSRP